MRRIAVFTSTRAEYGLLRPLMAEVASRSGLALQVIASGTHLSEAHGATWRELVADGFPIDARVAMTIAADDAEKVSGNQKKVVGGSKSQNVAGQLLSSVGKDQVSQVVGNLLSMTGGERIQQTLGNASQQALSHQITSTVGTTISCGQSMIYIGPDAIIIQSPKILLNPGEETAASAALGDGIPSLTE